MTSNQIAAEANRIQERQNEWVRNHNDEVREETRRHNEAMEENSRQQVRATEHANTIQENWNRWQQQWQEQYTAKYKEYELAQEDKKIAIQQDLAWMEERKADAEIAYKAAQEANLAYMQGLASEQLELDKAFKTWQKEIGEKNYQLNSFEAAVKAKQVEYDYSVRHEQNVIARDFNVASMDHKWALLNWEREKTNAQLANQLQIANYTYEIGKSNIEIAKQNLELYRKQVRAQNFASYSSGLFGRSGIVPGTFETGKNVIDILPFGGFANGKTQKQIFESLFE